jgi:hypothetical protein
MEKRWYGKSVDLSLLTTHIGEFLKERGFEAVKAKTQSDGYKIFAGYSPSFRLNGYIAITVEGKPDDFSIRLELYEGKGKTFPVLLSTLFFGGYFISKRVRSIEDWVRLEREFWTYVDNMVLQLTRQPV